MADIQVANTDANLSGNTLLTEEEAYTITGLHTYNRSTNPPIAVASGAAKVDNLDADKLDGQTGTYYAVAANVLLKDGSVALTANWDAGGYEILSNTFESDVATGTAPLTIASTTLVANLNADLLDGQEGSYYLAAANATGTLSVAKGGTGLSSYAAGDVIYASGTTTLAKLVKATDGDVLTLASGVPSWATPTVGDITAVTAGAGMTGGGTTGDVTLNVIGTADKITVSADAVTIATGYVGQTSITTLGTIATGVWEGTDVGVAHGGTGVSTLTDGGLLLGSGAGAITALAVATNGQIPIGDGAGDPVLATITGTTDHITVTNGAGAITLSHPTTFYEEGTWTPSSTGGSWSGGSSSTGTYTRIGDVYFIQFEAAGTDITIASYITFGGLPATAAKIGSGYSTTSSIGAAQGGEAEFGVSSTEMHLSPMGGTGCSRLTVTGFYYV